MWKSSVARIASSCSGVQVLIRTCPLHGGWAAAGGRPRSGPGAASRVTTEPAWRSPSVPGPDRTPRHPSRSRASIHLDDRFDVRQLLAGRLQPLHRRGTGLQRGAVALGSSSLPLAVRHPVLVVDGWHARERFLRAPADIHHSEPLKYSYGRNVRLERLCPDG